MAVFRVVKQSPKSKFILKRNFDFWIPHLLKTIIKYMLCLILYNPTDCPLPGSSVHGILQARILERVAYPSSSWSSWTRNRTRVSCIADRLFTNWVIREDPSYSRGSSQSRNWTHIFLRLPYWIQPCILPVTAYSYSTTQPPDQVFPIHASFRPPIT